MLAELEAFVTLVRNDPSILHRPELAFFRSYLHSLGARIPEPPADEQPDEQESEEEVFQEDSLNDDEVVAPETIPLPELAPTGKELTDDDHEKLAKAKEAAAEAVEIDYDENIWDMQKLVEQKYKTIEEHERAAQRKKEEKARRERERRAREQRAHAQRAYEEQKKREPEKGDHAAVECLVEGCLVGCLAEYPAGCPAGCLAECLAGCLAACPGERPAECLEGWPVSDIMTNPGNMAKYKDDPEVAEAISKLTRKFGGVAGGSMPGGMPGAFGPSRGFN
ncbi:hypothetical protein ACSSS7_004535 [Eimeria intestinalis]